MGSGFSLQRWSLKKHSEVLYSGKLTLKSAFNSEQGTETQQEPSGVG